MSKKEQELRKALEKAQDTAAFYQTSFQKAEQISKAVKEGHAATPGFKPDFLDDKEYIEPVRKLCKQAVYAHWNQHKQAATLWDIYSFVKRKIQEMIQDGTWDTKKTFPGKRTVDRRTNETADPKCWNGLPPCLGVGRGRYIPNPALFDEETRQEILKLTQ